MTAKTGAPTRAQAADEIDGVRVPGKEGKFRFDLAHLFYVFIANKTSLWRSCRERGCKRARSCQSPRRLCSNLPFSPYDAEGFPYIPDTVRRGIAEHAATQQQEERAAEVERAMNRKTR